MYSEHEFDRKKVYSEHEFDRCYRVMLSSMEYQLTYGWRTCFMYAIEHVLTFVLSRSVSCADNEIFLMVYRFLIG